MIYQSIETNLIQSKDELKKVLQNKVPDGAIYFEGIVSNGDKNRNGYIIDEDAWFVEKSRYVKDFLKSGSVLYGHDPEKPIGRPLSFEKTDNGIQVTGYVFDDVYTNGAIGRGLILGLSTGHNTIESVYRNSKTGVEIPADEFYMKIWEDSVIYKEYVNGLWDWVVTKAEIIEFSFTTTPSNRKSVLNEKQELLVNEISKTLNKDLNEVKTLFSKYDSMEITKEQFETLQNAHDVLKTEVSTKDTEINSLKDEVAGKDVEINSIKETLTNKDTELETLKNSLNEMTNKVTEYEEKQKALILANAKLSITDKNEVKDMNAFVAKHKAN